MPVPDNELLEWAARPCALITVLKTILNINPPNPNLYDEEMDAVPSTIGRYSILGTVAGYPTGPGIVELHIRHD